MYRRLAIRVKVIVGRWGRCWAASAPLPQFSCVQLFWHLLRGAGDFCFAPRVSLSLKCFRTDNRLISGNPSGCMDGGGVGGVLPKLKSMKDAPGETNGPPEFVANRTFSRFNAMDSGQWT